MNDSPYGPPPDGQPGSMRPVRPPRPVVTYTIMAITILVFVGQSLTPIEGTGGLDLLILMGGMRAALIQQGQIWRLITPALLHFSMIHIGANMYSLFILGPVLEQFFGRWRFLALYVLAAFGGNVLSFYMNRNALAAGASTAIFGLIAAQGIFVYLNRELFGDRARAMLQSIFFLILLNLGLGLSFRFDNWGHMGGLLTGLAFTWFAGPKLEVERGLMGGVSVVDRNAGTNPWIVAFVIAAVLAGLAFVRIMTV